MSKKAQKAPIAEVKAPAQFEIDGVVYTEGDPLQIIAPELGIIIPTKWDFETYSTKGIVSFDLGWVKTPLTCGSPTHNATMGLTCTRLAPSNNFAGSNYNELLLVYFCHCRHGVHNSNLRWKVKLENGIIQADAIGWDHVHRNAHKHPLVEGYKHLIPAPIAFVEQSILSEKTKPIQLQLF